MFADMLEAHADEAGPLGFELVIDDVAGVGYSEIGGAHPELLEVLCSGKLPMRATVAERPVPFRLSPMAMAALRWGRS
ncbi:MAG TPA: hypothetical protein VF814_04680 [Casimicrobiaceae bacterium]